MECLEIFLSVLPGLEPVAADEARAAGFDVTEVVPGGVTLAGGWDEVRRANLWLRVPGRVLVRLASFRAMHLAQLDKRLRKLDWVSLLRPDVAVRVEASCRKSRIYHDRAAAQRLQGAIADAVAPPAPEGDAPQVTVMLRIEDDLATVSLDSSGAPLHRRGTKLAVGKAPLRETMAAAFLLRMGFDGRQTVVDPMCGSGTIPIEAAQMAAGLAPGRVRSFAFELLAGFDAAQWADQIASPKDIEGPARFFGRDRDQGAVGRARQNAERAGVAALCDFERAAISDLTRPKRPSGIVLVNPPYGGRLGQRDLLRALYGSFGKVMKAQFAGWQVGLITSEPSLANATGLPLGQADLVIPHGGMRIGLYRCQL